MMEAVCTSETSVNMYLATRQYIPEDSKLHTHRLYFVQKQIISNFVESEGVPFIIYSLFNDTFAVPKCI
jgi:hypothetical protein